MTSHAPSFDYRSTAAHVVFGHGSLQRLNGVLDELEVTRVLVLCTPEQRETADCVAGLLGKRAASVFDGAMMHVPLDVARTAVAAARAAGADGMVAVGGGSTIGLGKAVALEATLPIVAVPTTFAGSEMTSIYGYTDGGLKRTGRDPRVLPRAVIYDPQLVITLPVASCVASGFNAMAHAIEALYAHDGNPVISLMAEEGLRAMVEMIDVLFAEPTSHQARERGMYGAWLCGTALGAVSMGLHHKLCHTLGGSFDLPHAQTHAAMLPHSVAYNAAYAPEAMARAARALGVAPRDVPEALYNRLIVSGQASALRDLGMPLEGIEHAADLAVSQPYPNPRPLDRGRVRDLIQRAFEGARPQLDCGFGTQSCDA